MAIQFSGEFTTPRTQQEVFDFLSDPSRFGPLLPDFQSMSMQDPTHFTVKVKVGVGNIRGSAEIKMELVEAVRPLRAQYKGQGNAVGSQVSVSAGFDLTPQAESTKVLWQGETSVFGKLASMAGGLLEPLGRKNIQKLIDGLQQALAQPAAPAEGKVEKTGETPVLNVETKPEQPAESLNVEIETAEGTREEHPAPAGESVLGAGLSPAPSTSSSSDDKEHGNDNTQRTN